MLKEPLERQALLAQPVLKVLLVPLGLPAPQVHRVPRESLETRVRLVLKELPEQLALLV